LRGGLTLLAVLAMAGAAVIWLPEALTRHAANIAPPAQALAVGKAILTDIARSTGAVCERHSGQTVLDWIAPQLISDDAKIRVVPAPVNGARRLPGDLYVLGNDVLLTATGPEAAAGHLIAAEMGSSNKDLLLDALEYA